MNKQNFPFKNCSIKRNNVYGCWLRSFAKVQFFKERELENQGCTKFAENCPMSKRKQNITNHKPILILNTLNKLN